jgi:Protein of unknown function (DUF3306)
MSADRKPPETFSLRRWSQRKLAVARQERSGAAKADAVPDQASALQTVAPAPEAAPAVAACEIGAAPAVARETTVEQSTPTLPQLDSLTFESDFTAFMQPGVDDNVRRKALRTLLRDPRFNVMDGLDVYIDDYSKPDPIAPEIVRQLAHARYLFDPPKTRVNDEGYVEDERGRARDHGARRSSTRCSESRGARRRGHRGADDRSCARGCGVRDAERKGSER